MNKDDWMPCDVELPESNDEYLVTWVGKIGMDGTFRGLEILEYDCDYGWITNEIETRGYYNVEVTAWMELPERYIEEE